MKIKFEGVLKSLALNSEIELKLPQNSTIKDLLKEIMKINYSLYKRIFDIQENDLQPDIYIAVNDIDIKLLNYLDTKLNDNDHILILAYIHGG